MTHDEKKTGVRGPLSLGERDLLERESLKAYFAGQGYVGLTLKLDDALRAALARAERAESLAEQYRVQAVGANGAEQENLDRAERAEARLEKAREALIAAQGALQASPCTLKLVNRALAEIEKEE